MNAATRTEIAAALSTVEGITGYPRQPRAPKPGDAWPQWAGGERDEASPGFLESWAIWVITDQGTPDNADAFLDQHGAALLEALVPAIYVDTYRPARVETEAGPMYALQLTGRTE